MANTRTRTPRRAVSAPVDPVPRYLRAVRTFLTFAGLAAAMAGLFLLAMALNADRSPFWPSALIAAGLAVSVAVQQPRPYMWVDDRVRNRQWRRAGKREARRDAKQQARAAKQAGRPAPRQRTRRRNQVPMIEPAAELGIDFRYIVLNVREMYANNQLAQLDNLNAWWDNIDWSDRLPGHEYHPYRLAVDAVYDLVAEHDGYDDDFDPRQLKDAMFEGEVDDTNPFVFLCEMNAYSPAAGAVAALMLVYDQVSEATASTVLAPWISEGVALPYRHRDQVWEPGRDGTYHARPVPPARRTPAPAAAGRGLPEWMADHVRPDGTPVEPVASVTTRPVRDMEEVLTDAAAAREARQLPAGQAPAVEPPAVEVTASSDGQADDVPDPTLDDVRDAARLCITTGFGSTPMVQRRMGVSRGLATKIMHRLHALGVLGEWLPEGKARVVHATPDELDEVLAFIAEEWIE